MLAGDGSGAEEMVGDIYLQAYKQWGAIANPHTWLAAVLARRAMNRKTQYRRQPVLRRLWASDRTAPPVDPLLLAEYREDARRVLEQMAVLPPQQRAVAVLWWLYDWPQNKIAVELKLKPSTVATHVRRAEQTMRRTFGQRGQALGP